MSKVTFYTDGQGKWWRRLHANKCNEKILFFSREGCQGVLGHENDHWCYDAVGSLIRAKRDGGWSRTPPDHKKYIPPVDMRKQCYLEFSTKAEPFEDEEKIKELEQGKFEPNESINGPAEFFDNIRGKKKNA